MNEAEIIYCLNPPLKNDELNILFANQEPTNYHPILERSLSYVCAFRGDHLIGFVNLAWDGGIHAFILDTIVHPEFRHRGIGINLVNRAAEVAQKRGMEWLHVDFEPHLQSFYDKCGFRNTNAGLIKSDRKKMLNKIKIATF